MEKRNKKPGLSEILDKTKKKQKKEIVIKKPKYPFPTDYNDRWEREALAVRDIFWKATKAERRKYAKLNPCIFGEHYIKPYYKRWNTHTAKHQYYMLYEGLKNTNIVIHIPVEHAKSTWFSLVLPLWFLINDRNTHGCILSNTATQAQGFLSAIKWNIEENEKFKNDFPEIVPDYKKKWTEKEIMIVRDKDKQGKDPTIIARGTGNAILGTRFEWLIADDICDLDNTATDMSRQKMLRWWNQELDSRVVESGRKIIIGTLQHEKDLLCTLADNKKYKYICLSALAENNAPLWEDNWSYERLMDKKETIGSLDFEKVMQNNRTTTSNKSLDVAWLNFYGVGEIYNFSRRAEGINFYMGIDPAIADDRTTAEKRRLDKFAIVVVGLDTLSKLMFVDDYYTDYLTFPEQLRVINDWYLRYSEIGIVKKIGIEQTAYQKALKQQAFTLKSLPPIVGVNTGTSSKATRIESLGVYFETKRIWIKRNQNDYIDEYKDFEPGGKSPNLLDATAIIVSMIKGVSNVSDIKVFKKHSSFAMNW